MNIPTIGFIKYKGLQELGAHDLLCETNECVLHLIKKIERGEMTQTLATIRNRVLVELDSKNLARHIMKFIKDIVRWKQLGSTAFGSDARVYYNSVIKFDET